MTMFIVVRCGNDEKLLFNPDCHISNLLDNMRERFNIENIDYTHLDLCDEAGIAKDLPKYLRLNGSRFLATPGTYVLVERRSLAVVLDDPSELGTEESRPMQTVYTSLLKNSANLIPGFEPRGAVLKTQNPKELRKTKLGKDLSKKRGSSPPLKSISNSKLKSGNKATKGGRGKK